MGITGPTDDEIPELTHLKKPPKVTDRGEKATEMKTH